LSRFSRNSNSSITTTPWTCSTHKSPYGASCCSEGAKQGHSSTDSKYGHTESKGTSWVVVVDMKTLICRWLYLNGSGWWGGNSNRAFDDKLWNCAYYFSRHTLISKTYWCPIYIVTLFYVAQNLVNDLHGSSLSYRQYVWHILVFQIFLFWFDRIYKLISWSKNH